MTPESTPLVPYSWHSQITHPIKSNFFPAISIVVLLFSIMAPPDERNLGKVLFAIGMVVQVGIIIFLFPLTQLFFSNWIFLSLCSSLVVFINKI